MTVGHQNLHRVGRCLLGVALGLLLPMAALAWADPDQKALAVRADEIRQHQERQKDIQKRIGDIAGQFNGLVEDMKANGLVGAKQAQDMKYAVQQLELAGNKYIQSAREHLLDASQDLSNSEHLQLAHRDINEAVRILKQLGELASSLETTEAVRRSLIELIKKQERLKDATKETGKDLLENKTDRPEEKTRPLAHDQKDLADQTGRLPDLLNKVKQGVPPEQREQLDRALEKVQQAQSHENAAARDLDDPKKLPNAAKQQDEALKALKDAVRELEKREKGSPLADNDKIEKLKELQKELQKETENTAPQSLQPLDDKQMELAKKAENAAKDLRPQAARPIEKAREHMDKAAKALEEGNKDLALKEQMNALDELQNIKPPDVAKANPSNDLSMPMPNTMKDDKGMPMPGAMKDDKGMPMPMPGDMKDDKGMPMPMPGAMKDEKSMPKPDKEGMPMPMPGAMKDDKGMPMSNPGTMKDDKGMPMPGAMKDSKGMSTPDEMGVPMPGNQGMKDIEGMNADMGMAKGMMNMDFQNMGEAKPEMAEQSGGKVMPKQKAFDPREGQRDFLPSKAPGDSGNSGDDTLKMRSLGARERGPEVEGFLRKLPLEYRDALEAYYKSLAR